MIASQTALTGYAIMWLYVMFDLPIETKKQCRIAARFRKNLMKDGFAMLQFSVYIRHCASNEASTVHINRVRAVIPEEGSVSILKVTDKQFGDTIHFVGRKRKPPPSAPFNLNFFNKKAQKILNGKLPR